MRKLITLMTSIVTLSPIINYSSNIDITSKISDLQSTNIKKCKKLNISNQVKIKNNFNLKKLQTDDYAKGIFLYNPNVNVNSTDNEPFINESTLGPSAYDDDKYMDNVFLKSLQWDQSNKLVISSLSNLQNRDNAKKLDATDKAKDENDYKQMQTLISQTNSSDSALQEGMSVLNRLINAGAVNFNNIGYVPDRETAESLMNDSSNVALSDSSEQQSVITFNKNSSNIDFSKFLGLNNDDEKISMNIHWYGISIYLPPKYLTNSVISYINDSNTLIDTFVNTAYDFLSKEKYTYKSKLENLIPFKGSNPVSVKNSLYDYSYDWYQRTTVPHVSNQNFNFNNEWENARLQNYEEGIFDPRNLPPEHPFRDELIQAYNERRATNNSQSNNVSSNESYGEQVASDEDATMDSDMVDTIVSELEEAGDAAAAASSETVIGPIIITALLLIIVIALPLIMSKTFQTLTKKYTNLKNITFDRNTATPINLNATYVNFIGEFTTTWTQKTIGNISPVYPSQVPNSVIIPPKQNTTLNGVYNLVTGSTNDFTIIMEPSIWSEFTEIALDNGANGISVSDLLKKANINDDNLYLSSTDWYNIIKQLKYKTLDPHCSAVLEVVNKEVTYTNIVDSTGKTNLEYNNTAYLTSSFIGKDSDDMSIILTKDQLSQLSNDLNLDKTLWTDIQKSPLNNPNNYTSFEEWFYANYIKGQFWIDSELSISNIENFVDRLITKYQSNGSGFSDSQIVNMTNDSNDVYQITSSMLN